MLPERRPRKNIVISIHTLVLALSRDRARITWHTERNNFYRLQCVRLLPTDGDRWRRALAAASTHSQLRLESFFASNSMPKVPFSVSLSEGGYIFLLKSVPDIEDIFFRRL